MSRLARLFSFASKRQPQNYKHKSSGKRVTVPYHAGKILHPKVLKNILADAGMTHDDLEESLK